MLINTQDAKHSIYMCLDNIKPKPGNVFFIGIDRHNAWLALGTLDQINHYLHDGRWHYVS